MPAEASPTLAGAPFSPRLSNLLNSYHASRSSASSGSGSSGAGDGSGSDSDLTAFLLEPATMPAQQQGLPLSSLRSSVTGAAMVAAAALAGSASATELGLGLDTPFGSRREGEQ